MNINKTIGNFNNHLGKLVAGLIIVLAILIVGLVIKDSNFVLGVKTEAVEVPSLQTTIIPTHELPTPTPITKQNYITPATDPIIDCSVINIGTIKTKASQCSISFACEIGRGKWYLYTSKEKCTLDQNSFTANYNKEQGNNTNVSINNNSYSAPSYPPCTVYYPSLGTSQTYSTFSPEYCKTLQDSARIGGTNTLQPTAIPVGKSQADIDNCKNRVRTKYDELIRGCSILYGETSGERQCQIVYGNEQNKAIAACGN